MALCDKTGIAAGEGIEWAVHHENVDEFISPHAMRLREIGAAQCMA